MDDKADKADTADEWLAPGRAVKVMVSTGELNSTGSTYKMLRAVTQYGIELEIRTQWSNGGVTTQRVFYPWLNVQAIYPDMIPPWWDDGNTVANE